MLKIDIKNTAIKFSLPENENEMTLPLATAMGMQLWKENTSIEKSIAFIASVGEFHKLDFNAAQWDFIGAQLTKANIFEKIDWLWQDDITTIFLPKIEVQKRTAKRIIKKNFIAPEAEMNNLKVLEWIKADEAFGEWVEAKKANDLKLAASKLNLLCGILYREKGFGSSYNPKHQDYCGDERAAFNVHLLPVYEANGATFFQPHKNLIAWQYYCNRKFLVEEFAIVFEESEGGSNGTVYEMIIGLTGTTFGDLTAVQNTFVVDAMVYMQKQILDAQKADIERNKQR